MTLALLVPSSRTADSPNDSYCPYVITSSQTSSGRALRAVLPVSPVAAATAGKWLMTGVLGVVLLAGTV